MKLFFSGISIFAIVFSLLIVVSGSAVLARSPQLPSLDKEAKKRLKEKEQQLKEEEEKRLKEKEQQAKADEDARYQENQNKLKDEETRLKAEKERKGLSEDEENRIKSDEKRLKEEEKSLKAERDAKLKEDNARLKEEEEKRLKDEQDNLRAEEENRRNGAAGTAGTAGGSAFESNNTATQPLKAEGLDVAILMKDSRGMFLPVDPSREFVNGEQFRVEYNSRLNGIVYFVNVDPKGVSTVIYRDEVSNGKKYVHPSPEENKVIQFGGSPGIEVLKIIISQKEVPELENALRENAGKMGTNKEQAQNELLGYVAPKQEAGEACAGLEFSFGGAKSECREFSVVSMRQDQGQISVALSPKDGDTGSGTQDSARLNPGEVAVLEIRLKHIQQ